MKYAEAREQLVRTWGQLSSAWGINRAMGQIHALLMIAPDPLTADHIIQELTLSRGSVSMSLRSLIEWGLVHKVYMPGDRKEYFAAEKDIWRVALRIALERKQRELDPIIHTLQSIQDVEDQSINKDKVEEINKMSAQLLDVAMQIDKVLDIGIRSGGQSIVRKLINVLR